MDDRFITWTYIWNMYVKLNIFYLCISQYPIIELGNNWLMGKKNFPGPKQVAGWKINSWNQAWRLEGKIISSLREHQGAKIEDPALPC